MASEVFVEWLELLLLWYSVSPNMLPSHALAQVGVDFLGENDGNPPLSYCSPTMPIIIHIGMPDGQ